MEKTSAKYEIIHELITREDSVQNVKELCRIACVSRSGYYNWVASQKVRESREAYDRQEFELILEAYKYKGYDKGARGIHMRLLHGDEPVLMNIKKIKRLMNKYNLVCPIRKANPARRIAKAIKTNSIVKNLLNREFREYGPRKVLLTDITYIPYCGVFCYLSVIIDAYTKQVLSYVLSESLEVDFVLMTVRLLIRNHGISLESETLIHSDQGCHYTSKKFRHIIKDVGLRQSMSRKGNCWDNAPQESFFGHMKDEIGGKISKIKNFKEVKEIVDDWMNYYNRDRCQWELAKLTPDEYYEFCKTDVYPLKKPKLHKWTH